MPTYSWTVALIMILGTLSMPSCKRPEESPKHLSEEQFVSLYASLLKNAQNMRNWGQDPKAAVRYSDSVFTSAGITRAEYDATVTWYNADVHRWRDFSEAVTHELERRDSLSQLPPSP